MRGPPETLAAAGIVRIVHGTGIVLGGTGVLLRGASGSGKSILALNLLERWGARGREALLVADDRVILRPETADGLTMHAPDAIAGMIELRGRGIVTRPHAPAAPLHLVVDLVPDLTRMPEAHEFSTSLFGAGIARCPVPQAGLAPPTHQMLLIEEAMTALGAR